MFGRKKQKPAKAEPELPRWLNMEVGFANLAAQMQREKAGNVRICCDLIAIRDKLDKAAEAKVDQAAREAAELHNAARALDTMINCLQGETETEPLQLTSAVSNGALTNIPADDAPSGFLARQ